MERTFLPSLEASVQRPAAPSAPAMIRAGQDDDAEGFIALIGACWAEYPGCVLDVDGEVPELRALASHVAAKGGALWAAEAATAVVGMVAIAPAAGEAGVWELSRLYVAAPYRGTGLAARLLHLAEGHAVAHGAASLLLWTDTRFTRAHRFYEKHGWRRTGETRCLRDLSATVEFRYEKAVVCSGPITR